MCAASMNSGGTGSPGVHSCTGLVIDRIGSTENVGARIGGVTICTRRFQHTLAARFIVPVQHMRSAVAQGGINLCFTEAIKHWRSGFDLVAAGHVCSSLRPGPLWATQQRQLACVALMERERCPWFSGPDAASLPRPSENANAAFNGRRFAWMDQAVFLCARTPSIGSSRR